MSYAAPAMPGKRAPLFPEMQPGAVQMRILGTMVPAGSTDAIDGLPTFADGARAVRITEAVLRSGASHRWEDVVENGQLDGGAT